MRQAFRRGASFSLSVMDKLMTREPSFRGTMTVAPGSLSLHGLKMQEKTLR